MMEITQADRDAGAQLNGYDSWQAWEEIPKHFEGWMEECAQAFARHRMEERAAIVAWLRGHIDGQLMAQEIGAGEHLK